MTSDILKHAAEAKLLPCPFCGRAAHLRDDASHSTAAFIGCETEGCFGYMLWAETATDAAREWNQRPDMAAAIAERDAEIARLTASSEAAEAQVANAGAVMVDACAREADAHYAAGDMGNPGHHIRALSTLSPIAAAARVLLANTEAENDPEIGPWLRALAEQEKADE